MENNIKKHFINEDYPNLFNLLPNASICVIGNSGNILKEKWGKKINSYDIVVRCNNGPIIGYEDYVGSKTTARLVNSHCFAGTTKKSISSSTSKDFLPNLKKQDLIIKINKWDENCPKIHSGIINNKEFHNIFFLNPIFQKTIMDSILNRKEPTTGFLGIQLLLKKFNHIDIFGFNPNNQDKYHYFDIAKKHSCHSNDEYKLLKNNFKRITIYE